MNRKQLEQWDRHMPEMIKRIQIQLLTLITAKAFRQSPVMVLQLPSNDGLEKYAVCTRTWMNQEQCHTDSDYYRSRLHNEALRAGTWMRRLSGFREPSDIRLLLILLYRNIGIKLKGDIPGEFQAETCYFARGYTPEQCGYMSEMDSGIMEGLFGGGKLYFTERITEGCTACKACFQMGEKR